MRKKAKARSGSNGEAEVDYLAIWRAKGQEQPKEEPPTIEREFGGLPCVAKRMSITSWIRAGQMPGFLVDFFARSAEGQDAAELRISELTSEQQVEFAHFRKFALCETIEKPKIVLGREPKAGEISYGEVVLRYPRFREEAEAWIMAGCPDIPVTMKGGETVNISDLETFR